MYACKVFNWKIKWFHSQFQNRNELIIIIILLISPKLSLFSMFPTLVREGWHMLWTPRLSQLSLMNTQSITQNNDVNRNQTDTVFYEPLDVVHLSLGHVIAVSRIIRFWSVQKLLTNALRTEAPAIYM